MIGDGMHAMAERKNRIDRFTSSPWQALAARISNTRASVRISPAANRLAAHHWRQLRAQLVYIGRIHEEETEPSRRGPPGGVECYTANGLVYMHPLSI